MKISQARFDALSELDGDREWEVTGYADVYRDFHTDVARIQTLFREAGTEHPQRRVVSLPLGELAGFGPGTRWRNGYCVGENEEHQRADIVIGPPEGGLEALSKFWSSDWLRRKACPEEAVVALARSRVTRHRVLSSTKRLRCEYVLLPCTEVYRRTFGSTTDFSTAVFDRRLLNENDLMARLHLNEPPSITLPAYLVDASAPLLAHYLLSPEMQTSARFLVDQYMSDFWRFGKIAPLTLPPPFTFPAHLTVTGQRYRTLQHGKVFVIRRLLSIYGNTQVPHELLVDRDNPVPIRGGDDNGASAPPVDPREHNKKNTRRPRESKSVSDASPANDDLSPIMMETERCVFEALNDVAIKPIYERPLARGGKKSGDESGSEAGNEGSDNDGDETKLTTAPGRAGGNDRPLNVVPENEVPPLEPCRFAYALQVLKHLEETHNVKPRLLPVSRGVLETPVGPINLFPALMQGETFYWAIMDRVRNYFRQCLISELRQGSKHLYLFEAQLRPNENRCLRAFAHVDMAPLSTNTLDALLYAFMVSEARSVAQLVDEYSGPRLHNVIIEKIAGLSESRFEHAEKRGGPERIAERMAALFNMTNLSEKTVIQGANDKAGRTRQENAA